VRGDTLWPPGVGTGVLCHANKVPFFNVAITNFRESFMTASWSVDTVHVTWLYVQPKHRLSKPKLEQSPFPLTGMLEKLRPPCLIRVINDMVGYKALNASTIFLQFGGMAVLMEDLAWPGRVPAVGGRAPAVATIGALGGSPMKDETGQVRVISMAQSSTS
jgi:hypothetical protein